MHPESKTVLRNHGGTYIAKTADVKAKVESMSKRQLIKELRGIFPEMFRDGVWTYHNLMQEPAYVLAVYLSQCE